MNKNKDGNMIKSLWSNLCYLMKGIWESDRPLLFMMILETVCMVISPYISIYLPKIGVDLVAKAAPVDKALLLVCGLAAVMMVSQAVGNAANRGKTAPLDQLRSYYRKKMFCKTLECDYTHVESAEWQDKYEQAQLMSVNWGPWSATTLMSEGAISLCGSLVSFILYGIIIASFSGWLLLLMVAVSLLNFVAIRKANRYECGRLAERSGYQRRRWYVYSRAQDTKMGKDTRLYEMTGWIEQVARHYQGVHMRLRQDVNNRYFYAAAVEAATLLLRDGVCYVCLIRAAAAGMISPGNFVLFCNAIAGFSSLTTMVSNSAGQMIQAVPPLNRMRDYLASKDDPDPEHPAQPPRKDQPVSVEFQDVCFEYIEGQPVLDHFCLKIEPGEKLALVGVNGAGKTTIVKLLCGFYKPKSGRLLVNGVSAAEYRREDLLQLVSTVFQDTAVFPFSVAENISLQPEEATDMARVEQCLKTAGLLEEIENYPGGIRTQMLREIDEKGIVLSGGQQQKLLMARALYKDAPIFIFDEPTAALDPVAESETYEQFHAFSGGKTTLYISHRLASTRFCDRIAFLKNGRVLADGNHEELLRSCPEYAEMFEVQSHYYRKGAVEA